MWGLIRKMNRTAMRENAFKCLYEVEVQNDISEEHIQMFFENNSVVENDAKEYIIDIINGVSNSKDEIIDFILYFSCLSAKQYLEMPQKILYI